MSRDTSRLRGRTSCAVLCKSQRFSVLIICVFSVSDRDYILASI